MSSLKKWWPSILPILSLIGMAVVPVVQVEIAKHPLFSAGLTLAYSILAHILPSPRQ